jgi:hypothetical protein
VAWSNLVPIDQIVPVYINNYELICGYILVCTLNVYLVLETSAQRANFIGPPFSFVSPN